MVALRVDTRARTEHGENQIPDDEYLEMMREYVRTAIKQQTLQLPSKTEVNIVIGSARKEKKLAFADYVCNARLTRNSGKFISEQIYYNCINSNDCKSLIKQFSMRYKEIISTDNIPIVTCNFVKQFETLINCNEDGLADIAHTLSRLITY